MPIIPGSEPTVVNVTNEDRDSNPIPVSKKLAVAGTSEVLFTIPVGEVGRKFSFVNMTGLGDAWIAMTPSTPAVAGAAGMLRLRPGDSQGEDGMELAEGAYEFIGDAGKRPEVYGAVFSGEPETP